MRRIVTMTGAFGAAMAFFGSLAAVVGAAAVSDAAGPGAQLARPLGAVGMSVLGLTGALVVALRFRTGGLLMGISAVGGVVLAPAFYAPGAVLLAAAVALVVRARPEEA